jgi:GNAT superfamily N-acetyltransferase
MLEEIQWLQAAVPFGVDWQILYDFREEFFDRKYLGEIQGWDGIRKRQMKNVTETGQLLQSVPRIGRYVRRVVFPSIGDIYQTKVSPTISVQIAKGEEWKPVIETICKAVDNPAVKSFPNIWTRFENWDKQPPYVAKMEDVVVGFMGLTVNKGEYVNFYDFAVLPECQHMGVGSALWEAALIVAREAGKTRIKCSADERYGGFPFYTRKLHWAPIAKKGYEYKFDAFIEGVGSVREFIMNRKRDLVQPPDKELEKYKKMDEFYGETKELNEANNKTGLAMWM